MVAAGLSRAASKSASVRRKERLEEMDARGGLGEGVGGAMGESEPSWTVMSPISLLSCSSRELFAAEQRFEMPKLSVHQKVGSHRNNNNPAKQYMWRGHLR